MFSSVNHAVSKSSFPWEEDESIPYHLSACIFQVYFQHWLNMNSYAVLSHVPDQL